MIDKRALLAFLTASFLGPTLVQAQAEPQATDPNAAAVSGSGTVVLKRRAERMRVRVDVFARGKTLPEALAALKDRREAIVRQLATLGASKESVAFEPTQINTSLLEARKQMEAMIRARAGIQPGTAPKKEAPVPAVVTTVLTAEWPLKAENAEDALVEAAKLQDAVKAADLAGMKEIEKPSSDDEEISEELAAMAQQQDPSQTGQPRPGSPTFLFIARVPPADRATALAEAFRKAREQAEATAKAAGAGLGPLRRVESSVVSSADLESSEMANMGYPYVRPSPTPAPIEGSEDESEVRGSQPGLVSCRVKVLAAFSLK